MDESPLTSVERRYQLALDKMTGLERGQRTIALCQKGWDMIALQVHQQHGEAITERELRYLVAERMYMGDSTFLALMKRAYEKTQR